VPVDCTTRDAGRFGDFVERGAVDAFRMKHAPGRINNPGSGSKGVFFGFAGHG